MKKLYFPWAYIKQNLSQVHTFFQAEIIIVLSLYCSFIGFFHYCSKPDIADKILIENL